jgi:hypothetical protein
LVLLENELNDSINLRPVRYSVSAVVSKTSIIVVAATSPGQDSSNENREFVCNATLQHIKMFRDRYPLLKDVQMGASIDGYYCGDK